MAGKTKTAPAIVWQYYSKWRFAWVDFKEQPPPHGEVLQSLNSNYKIRIIKRAFGAKKFTLPKTVTAKNLSECLQTPATSAKR